MNIDFFIEGRPEAEPRPRKGKKVTDATLLAAYEKAGSVHVAARTLGLNHASVHERLVKMGRNRRVRIFTDIECERLRREYLIYRNAGRLDELARSMGRTKPFICRQARTLGLTRIDGPKPFAGKWKYMSQDVARVMMDDFKSTPMTVVRFCKVRHYDDLGFATTMKRFFPDEWEPLVESKHPSTTKYRLGRQFEYRVRDHLRNLGYFVLRSPASRSPIDLVAIKPGTVLFVQCKVSGALGVKDWNELLALSATTGSIPLLAERAGYKTLEYRRLIGPKDGSKRPQPYVLFDPC